MWTLFPSFKTVALTNTHTHPSLTQFLLLISSHTPFSSYTSSSYMNIYHSHLHPHPAPLPPISSLSSSLIACAMTKLSFNMNNLKLIPEKGDALCGLYFLRSRLQRRHTLILSSPSILLSFSSYLPSSSIFSCSLKSLLFSSFIPPPSRPVPLSILMQLQQSINQSSLYQHFLFIQPYTRFLPFIDSIAVHLDQISLHSLFALFPLLFLLDLLMCDPGW